MTRKLSETPLVHETAKVENSTLGRWTEIADNCRVSETVLGDYSYMMESCMTWCAQIGKDGVTRNLGYHDKEEDAARAYDAKARELYGDAARLNYPDDAR